MHLHHVNWLPVSYQYCCESRQVTIEEVEQSMAEFGETPSSDKDVVSPSNAELVCMAFGKSVIFSQAVLVRICYCTPTFPFSLITILRYGIKARAVSS